MLTSWKSSGNPEDSTGWGAGLEQPRALHHLDTGVVVPVHEPRAQSRITPHPGPCEPQRQDQPTNVTITGPAED
jgi:hypothetical protein